MMYPSTLGSSAMLRGAGNSNLDKFVAIEIFLVPHKKVVK